MLIHNMRASYKNYTSSSRWNKASKKNKSAPLSNGWNYWWDIIDKYRIYEEVYGTAIRNSGSSSVICTRGGDGEVKGMPKLIHNFEGISKSKEIWPGVYVNGYIWEIKQWQNERLQSSVDDALDKDIE